MEAYRTDLMTKECLEEISKLPNDVLNKVAEKLNYLGCLDNGEFEAYYLLANVVIGMMESKTDA